MSKDDFPQHDCGGMRRFQPKWFSEFNWLEYSVDKYVHIALFVICSKITTNFQVEIVLSMVGSEIEI
jgi:hypothetical protein